MPNPFHHDMRQCADCGRVECIDDIETDADRCEECAEIHAENLTADTAWAAQFARDNGDFDGLAA